MNAKWLGAIFIIAGCGSCGFSAAAAGKREVRMLREFIRAISLMRNELQYRLSTLPELCRQASDVSSGAVREVFANLARELDWQTEPDACSCMAEALEKSHVLPKSVRKGFLQLGSTLGRFDLSGQIQELDHLQFSCEQELENCTRDEKIRLRSYRTLGLCAGAALTILLL